jgi:hypothetical protein
MKTCHKLRIVTYVVQHADLRSYIHIMKLVVPNLTKAFSSEARYQPAAVASGTTPPYICQTEIASPGQSHAKHCTDHLKTEQNVPANKIRIK